MAEETFRGQTATVDIATEGGTTVTVGALQNVEVSVEFEDEELRGQSLKRVDIQRVASRVSVEAEHGQFDIAGLKDLVGYDSGNSEIEDTPETPQFEVTVNLISVSGNVDEDVIVKNVVFDSISLGWDRDGYVTENVSGEGDDLEFVDQTA